MEKEDRNIPRIMKAPVETEFLLQWGSRKRLRCVRVRGNSQGETSSSSSSRIRRRITSRFLTLSPFSQSTSRYTRSTEMETLKSEIRKPLWWSPEQEERYYATRGSTDDTGKTMVDAGPGKQGGDEENHHHHHHEKYNSNRKLVWPKLCIALTSKEKEEDFMAMKGSKLPQRPKKRAKLIQRTLLLVSPGAWLSEMSLERYQVREKKSCRKKARGLKGIGSMDSDSE